MKEKIGEVHNLYAPVRTRQKIIGQRVLEHFNFLQKLAKTKSEGRRCNYLKGASSDQLLSIVEIAKNLVNSNFPLTGRQKNRLLPYANCIRKLSRARSERGTKRLILQKGDGLGFIPALLAPIIVEAARQLISSKSD